MAAPMLSNTQKAACLKKAVTISKKVKLKNVLCGETQGWPKPTREVEECIILQLSEILKRLPNIFKPVKNGSKQDQEAKRKVRSQLDLGTNSVCRSLEKDRLACVLVSSQVKPAAAADHVISVARERGCPLLCLDTLSTTLAKVTKSKCFPLCIGFKKLAVSSSSDFVDIISLVQQNTDVTKRPFTLKSLNKLKKEVTTTSLPESLRPVSLDRNTDEAVRQGLARIFSNAAIKDDETKVLTHKDRKRNKNKKKKVKQYYRKWLHNQFESGKKTVTDFVGIGKIRLVLVIKELLPVLMTEQPTSSLLSVARDMDCPVIVLSSLSMVKCADSAKAMAVLGIKKETVLPNNVQSAFNPVIDLCVNFMRTAMLPVQDMDIEGMDNTDIKSSFTQDVSEGVLGTDYSYLYISKKESTELQEKAMKLKEEEKNTSKQMTFTSDFISLSGGDNNNSSSAADANSVLGKRKSVKPLSFARNKPKKMSMDSIQPQANISSSSSSGFLSFSSGDNVDSNVEKDDVDNKMAMDLDQSVSSSSSIVSQSGSGGEVQGLFSISRAGNASKNKSNAAQNIKEQTTYESTTLSSSGALGVNELEKTKDVAMDDDSKHIADVFTATSKKGKGEDKKRHGQEGFMSFAYTEANIHTMVANPSKKKKKKKGGK